MKTAQYVAYEQGWEDADKGRTCDPEMFERGSVRESYQHGWNLRLTVDMKRGKQAQPARPAMIRVF